MENANQDYHYLELELECNQDYSYLNLQLESNQDYHYGSNKNEWKNAKLFIRIIEKWNW